MTLRYLITLLLAGSLYAAPKEAKPLLEAELDSIECHFAPQADQVPCTVRIHLKPAKGVSIAPQHEVEAHHAPLHCVDGEGNLLLGTFRGWEDCYDSNDHCYTIAYDFYTTPKGSSISTDTHIPIPLKRSDIQPIIVSFSPKEKKKLDIAGHQLEIEPREATKEAKRAAQVSFDIVYAHADSLKLIRLCTASGEVLKYRALIRDTQKAGIHIGEQPRVTYIIPTDKATLHLAITPVPHTSVEQIPLRFRASIGSLEEKPATAK